MKIILLALCAALASCSAPTKWASTPNPLDNPGGDYEHGWHPASMGKWGPHGNRWVNY